MYPAVPHNNRFSKEERLRHKLLVDALFSEGKNIYDYPLRLCWRPVSPEALISSFRKRTPEQIGKIQMLITVPKKKRRRAVDRVLIRRRIREAYRLNRHKLAETVKEAPSIGTLSIAFIYLASENLSYSEIETKMIHLLHKLQSRIAAISHPTSNIEE